MCAPRDAAEAKRKLEEYRKFNDDFQSRGVLLEQLRQRVYDLTANRDSVPGMLDIETQLAQLGMLVYLSNRSTLHKFRRDRMLLLIREE